MFDVIGSHSAADEAEPQEVEPVATTFSAAWAYLFRTAAFISWSAMITPLAAGGEQADQRRHRVPLDAIVDVPLFLAAFEESGPAEQVEVMGQRRAGNLHFRLNLADGQFFVCAHQTEEDLEPRKVSQS